MRSIFLLITSATALTLHGNIRRDLTSTQSSVSSSTSTTQTRKSSSSATSKTTTTKISSSSTSTSTRTGSSSTRSSTTSTTPTGLTSKSSTTTPLTILQVSSSTSTTSTTDTAQITPAASLSPSQSDIVVAAASASSIAQGTNSDLGVVVNVKGSAFGDINGTGVPAPPDLLPNADPKDICNRVSQFYGQTSEDWAKYNTDSWLSSWIDEHAQDIIHLGFAAALGEWATGNPNVNCKDAGGKSSCDFRPCSLRAYNVKEDILRQVYYVTTSIRRMHSFFIGLSEAISVAGITSALSKDSFVTTFYRDTDKPDLLVMRQVFNAISTVLGVMACGMGFGGATIANGGGAVTGIFQGGLGAIGPLVSEHIDGGFKTLGEVGMSLAQLYGDAMARITKTNNDLLTGTTVESARAIADILRNGSFLAYPGLDKSTLTNLANQFFIAQTINAMWRAQKIFIIGGAACGDDQGIGSGPQNNMVCRDGKAWYLYWWVSVNQGPLAFKTTDWIDAPTGADQLGKGLFVNVTVANIIDSSLSSWRIAGNNYSTEVSQRRMSLALNTSLLSPLTQGPSLEGVFTIPVCNISGMLNKPNIVGRQYILQPYGNDRKPNWCDPSLCSDDREITKAFLAAANMKDFNAPWEYCQTRDFPVFAPGGG